MPVMWALRTTGKEDDAPAEPMAKVVAGGRGGIEGAGHGGRGACFQLACHPWPVDGVPTDGFHPWLWWVGPGKGHGQTSFPRPAVLQLGEGAGQSVVHGDGGKNKPIVLSPRVTHGRESQSLGGCCGRLWEKPSSGGPGPPHCPLFPYQAHSPPALPGLEQTLRCPEWTQDEREQIAFITHATAMTPTR